jgi:hypothetical protein
MMVVRITMDDSIVAIAHHPEEVGGVLCHGGSTAVGRKQSSSPTTNPRQHYYHDGLSPMLRGIKIRSSPNCYHALFLVLVVILALFSHSAYCFQPHPRDAFIRWKSKEVVVTTTTCPLFRRSSSSELDISLRRSSYYYTKSPSSYDSTTTSPSPAVVTMMMASVVRNVDGAEQGAGYKSRKGDKSSTLREPPRKAPGAEDAEMRGAAKVGGFGVSKNRATAISAGARGTSSGAPAAANKVSADAAARSFPNAMENQIQLTIDAYPGLREAMNLQVC